MNWKTKQTDKLRRLASIYDKRHDQEFKTIVGGDGFISAFDKEVSFFLEYEEVDEYEAYQLIMKVICLEKANKMLAAFDDVIDTEFAEEILNNSLELFMPKLDSLISEINEES